jgi:hypothetical protein
MIIRVWVGLGKLLLVLNSTVISFPDAAGLMIIFFCPDYLRRWEIQTY